LIELGRIVSAYGIRGWVKIQPHAVDGDTLLAAETLWLKAPLAQASSGASPFPVRVIASRRHSAAIVAQLEGIVERDAAEALKSHAVLASRQDFPAAQDDEYYWVDLVGCRLYGERQDGEPALLGQVRDVIENGAHAILRVARASFDESGQLVWMKDSKDRPQEVLVPFVAAHVHTVDLAGKRLDSNWPVDF
jgi:16S rRNA processing protein RimM